MDELNKIEIRVAQLEGLTKAYVDTIKDLVERVDELEENRHDPKQAFLDDAVRQYKEPPFNPMSSRFTRREYVDGREDEERAKEMERERSFSWGRPPNCS